MDLLHDKAAVVTGATAGIGAATVKRFVSEGALVVGVARHLQTRGELAGVDETRFKLVSGDVQDPNTSERAVREVLQWTGRLDVLVNNAGVDFTGDLLEAEAKDVKEVFAVNALGAVFALQAAARAMRQQEAGAIINVTSRLATAGLTGAVIYGASKGAVLALTLGAAVELAPYGIRVNAVAPGLTETPLMRAWLDRQADPARHRAAVVSAIPQGRFGTPSDVSAAIAFLASDQAAHITGSSLPVDGGYTAA